MVAVCPFCNNFVDCTGVYHLGSRECVTCKKQLMLVVLSDACYCASKQDFEAITSDMAGQWGISEDAMTNLIIKKIESLDSLDSVEFCLDLEEAPSGALVARLREVLKKIIKA